MHPIATAPQKATRSAPFPIGAPPTFAARARGLLKQHRADGVVTIHVLEGRLKVIVDDEAREVGRDEIMALAPGVLHSVLALAPSDMLLTVHRMPEDPTAG